MQCVSRIIFDSAHFSKFIRSSDCWMHKAVIRGGGHSPVGVISTFSVERLLIYSPYIGGLTVRGVRLALPSTLHTGIATAWSRTSFTYTSQSSRVTLCMSLPNCHLLSVALRQADSFPRSLCWSNNAIGEEGVHYIKGSYINVPLC